jgi:hypothetical protein
MKKQPWPRFQVHLIDEVPGIASGIRIVEAKIGRKWVRVRQPQRNAHKIARRVWDKIGASAK